MLSKNGYYGQFGGSFTPEILHNVMQELVSAYTESRQDPLFWQEFTRLLQQISGRPTPLMFAENLTRRFNGPKIYIKREDFNHTGAHKFNNALGQALLAKKMGKTRIIAETGAGQHGVATASVAAKLGLECTIYMGEIDMQRQYPNVFWMRRFGATVVPVSSGEKTLKDAVNAALGDWTGSADTTHYVLGTVCGPHPFPEMVAWFQSIIGIEARDQILKEAHCLPTAIYACVGGGSNAMGCFGAFIEDQDVQLIGVEAAGEGIETGKHSARLASPDGSIGIAQGYKSFFLQNKEGQMSETHSVAAGLDYVGVSPIIAYLAEQNRVRMISATDVEANEALITCMKCEGIIPALESSHAFAGAFKEVSRYTSEDVILINQSGRGDKDIFNIAEALNDAEWKTFIQSKAEQNHGH
ncbi:MAG: tryptophan synthase subunit beta [Gammaproteobacteria bacterium]|jgi:tryptophan synthase beta chain|nr:tryptophan synthase subunit beta [Gammaproteobacteria bacterium]